MGPAARSGAISMHGGGSGGAACTGPCRIEDSQSLREAEHHCGTTRCRCFGQQVETLTRFSHCISFLFFFFLPPMKIKFVSSISVFIYLFLGVSSP